MVFLAVKHRRTSFYSEIIQIDNRMCWSFLPNMQKQMCFSWLEPALSSLNCVCSYLLSAEQIFRVLLVFVRHNEDTEAPRNGAVFGRAVLNLR